MSFMSEIGFSTKRYEYFVRNSTTLHNRMLGHAEDSDRSFTSANKSIHIAEVLDRETVADILDNDDLESFGSFASCLSKLQGVDEQDLEFGDFPAVNDLIRQSVDKRKAFAAVLALNESFVGFIRVIEYYFQNQTALERFVSLHEKNDEPEYSIMLALEITLKEDIPELPEVDSRDAGYAIYGMMRL